MPNPITDLWNSLFSKAGASARSERRSDRQVLLLKGMDTRDPYEARDPEELKESDPSHDEGTRIENAKRRLRAGMSLREARAIFGAFIADTAREELGGATIDPAA